MQIIDLLLIEVKYPENVGSIYRLAFQFNIRTIYLYQSAESNRANTYKTERHIPIIKIDSLEFLTTYPHPKYLLETGESVLTKESISDPVFLIAVANESYGASDEQKQYFDQIFSLNAPRRPSYNVSHALAIGLYQIIYE